jgi:hypothetical protein
VPSANLNTEAAHCCTCAKPRGNTSQKTDLPQVRYFCGTNGVEDKCMRGLVGKPEGNRPL